jgi:NAD(P)-dependent dehydrogenase (short-subunit alcohol dehydrogenase family)
MGIEGNGFTPAKRLEGKVALVFGGGQSAGEGLGNGRATALRFAREGARVLVANKNVDSGEQTVGLIRKEGGEAAAVDADVTVETQVAAAVAEAVRRWRGLDILHNNVGVSVANGDGELTTLSAEILDKQYRVNFLGAALACKHALPVMRERHSGAIINVSSAAATGLSPFAGYKAMKAAINALTEQLALQNAPFNIRVNAIMPGLIATPMAVETRARSWNKPRDELMAERNAKVPLGRAGTAWDVANLALFLASDEAAFITGECILVDGGRILNRI